MIARDIADLLHADRIEEGKWIANCPTHDDHEFQLRVTDVPGCAGRVQCRRRCSIKTIAKALGIRVLDLELQPVLVPESDVDETDDAAVRKGLARKRKREEMHEIASGRIKVKLRQVKWLQRLSENARSKGMNDYEEVLEETLAELCQLREIEKKWRA